MVEETVLISSVVSAEQAMAAGEFVEGVTQQVTEQVTQASSTIYNETVKTAEYVYNETVKTGEYVYNETVKTGEYIEKEVGIVVSSTVEYFNNIGSKNYSTVPDDVNTLSDYSYFVKNETNENYKGYFHDFASSLVFGASTCFQSLKPVEPHIGGSEKKGSSL